MPRIPKVKPMLAKLVGAPFDNDNYIYEIKWDGYRALAEIQNKKVELYSRNFKSFNENYPQLVKLLEKVKESVLLDGEIVAYEKGGGPSFQLLQNIDSNRQVKIEYIIFDILYFNGKNIMTLPLLKRKEILGHLLKKYPSLTASEFVKGKGKKFFELAKKKNLEGIMAKEINNSYLPGRRSDSWLKIKNHKTDEGIILGFTEPRGKRKYFGALVMGQFDKKGELKFIGHTGTGFDEKTLTSLYKIMKKLETKKSPLAEKIPLNTPVTWIRPKLIAELKFAEWTGDHLMRQPVFLGLREDKSTKEVRGEKIKQI